MRAVKEDSKNKFIISAMTEMQEHGIADFSVRRVAERCGTSSGAPYRHFDGKNGLILEVLRFVNESWHEIQVQTLAQTSDDVMTQLIEISMSYIKFLCEHPGFQTILMLNDSSLLPEQRVEKVRISDITTELIEKYCAEVNMSDEDKQRKTYAVRSFIFGAAIMINSGYMPLDDKTLGYARRCIAREFDLR